MGQPRDALGRQGLCFIAGRILENVDENTAADGGVSSVRSFTNEACQDNDLGIARHGSWCESVNELT